MVICVFQAGFLHPYLAFFNVSETTKHYACEEMEFVVPPESSKIKERLDRFVISEGLSTSYG